jgi:hypothetical protein
MDKSIRTLCPLQQQVQQLDPNGRGARLHPSSASKSPWSNGSINGIPAATACLTAATFMTELQHMDRHTTINVRISSHQIEPFLMAYSADFRHHRASCILANQGLTRRCMVL